MSDSRGEVPAAPDPTKPTSAEHAEQAPRPELGDRQPRLEDRGTGPSSSAGTGLSDGVGAGKPAAAGSFEADGAREAVPSAPAFEPRDAGAGGWTGGQYSLGRAFFAGALVLHFWAAGFEVDSTLGRALHGALALSCACVALGFGGRALVLATAALLSAANLTQVYGEPEFSAYALTALLLHAATPQAPFGSFAAFGRIDPAGDWRYPAGLGRLAWWLLGAECLLRAGSELLDPAWRSGAALATLLEGPAGRSVLGQRLAGIGRLPLIALAWMAIGLKLIFSLAAFSGRGQKGAWWTLWLASLVALLFIDFTSEGLGRLLILPFAFQPSWIPPRRTREPELLFYDGACGLCHRAVRFLLAEDPSGQALRYAPLRGARFDQVVPVALQAALPDSLILVTAEGEALDKSRALLHALTRLGGLWRVAAVLGSSLPVALADPLYDAIARIRHRLFETPSDACPVLPPHLRTRFDP